MATLHIPLCQRLVQLHTLGVDAVVVFADGHIQRAVDLGAMHVELHLHEVLGLGLLDSMLLKVGKALGAVRLELSHMVLLGCLRHARLDDGVDAARHMRAKVHARLVAASGAADVQANGTQVCHDGGLFHLAPAKQA